MIFLNFGHTVRSAHHRAMITILYARCSDARMEPALYAHRLARIPQSMQAQVRRYRKWQDAQACLAGKILLQNGLESLTNDADALSRICYNEFGRPFMPGSSLDFNISHAGVYVVCALGGSQRVGIDLECVRPVDIELFRNQVSLHDWNLICAAPDKTNAFYEYWTRREAVAKADGRGLGVPFSGMAVSGGAVCLDGEIWHLQNVPFASGYACHLAASQPGPFRLINATVAFWMDAP